MCCRNVQNKVFVFCVHFQTFCDMYFLLLSFAFVFKCDQTFNWKISIYIVWKILKVMFILLFDVKTALEVAKLTILEQV